MGKLDKWTRERINVPLKERKQSVMREAKGGNMRQAKGGVIYGSQHFLAEGRHSVEGASGGQAVAGVGREKGLWG